MLRGSGDDVDRRGTEVIVRADREPDPYEEFTPQPGIGGEVDGSADEGASTLTRLGCICFQQRSTYSARSHGLPDMDSLEKRVGWPREFKGFEGAVTGEVRVERSGQHTADLSLTPGHKSHVAARCAPVEVDEVLGEVARAFEHLTQRSPISPSECLNVHCVHTPVDHIGVDRTRDYCVVLHCQTGLSNWLAIGGVVERPCRVCGGRMRTG